MNTPTTATRSGNHRTKPDPPWSPVCAYNNLPPVPREQLRTPAIEARCELATAALRTLRDATTRYSDPETLFQTVSLVEAQASSAIEGIVTTVTPDARGTGESRACRTAATPRPTTRCGTTKASSTLGSAGTPSPSAPRWRSEHARRPRAAACRYAADGNGNRRPTRIIYTRPPTSGGSARCSKSCGA